MKKNFFENNRKKLMEQVPDNSITILFSGRSIYKSGDETYDFVGNKNFGYLTGINRENIILLMNKINGKVNEILFIERPDPIMARWVGEKLPSKEAEKLSGIKDIRFLEDMESTMASMINRFDIDLLFLDLERQEWDIPYTISQTFAKNTIEKYPYMSVKNIYSYICKLRMIKSQDEVEVIKDAIEITKKGIDSIMNNLKPGIMEYEIESYFDFVLNSAGVKDRAFKTIAASGKNATVLHYSENNCKTKTNDLILFDLGAGYNNYNADISRTFPVNGKFTKRQKEVYNKVLQTNELIIASAKPGVSMAELNKIAIDSLTEGCRELGILNNENEITKYYFHSIGHPLGADTHDVGPRNFVLEPGMVITDEPGLYIEEEGIGVRIEDDLLITENGCEVLSKDIIKTVEDIETFMKKSK